MSHDDDGLIQEFVAEAKEHLSTIEPDLLLLEREGKAVGQDIINRIFRAIHSIKGAASFFGFERLKRLSHVMESVLMQIRDGHCDPKPPVVEPLLKGVDRLNEMVEDIDASENVGCDEEIAWLERILKNDVADSIQPTTTAAQASTVNMAAPPATQPQASSSGDSQKQIPYSENTIKEAARFGHHFFQLELLPESDLIAHQRSLPEFVQLITSAGNLYLNSPFSQPANLTDEINGNITLLYSSVLEPDLISMSFDLPESRIKPVTLNQALGQVEADEAVQQQIAQQLETLQKAEAKAPAAKAKKQNASGENTETVRVRVDLLNKMMDLAGEMVLSRNQLLSSLDSHLGGIPGLSGILQNVDLVTSDLQEHIMQTRMQSVGTVFSKFPRVVRDIAKTLGKEINLEMTGEDVELDKSIIESLSDPLTHLIRNCCDHGIELPAERVKAGKSAYGTIQLKAYHEAGQINIAIIDDGKGIDPHRIVQKALLNGALTEADVKKMSPQDMVQLIFLPGLSTAEKVSDISGRGVGMDVVRTNIEQIGGSIQIDSQMGKGTTMLLRLPLTLAIIPSLIVGVENQRFAMPQINVVEMVRVQAADLNQKIEKVGSATVLRLRGNLLPLVDLSQTLNVERTIQQENKVFADRRLQVADSRQEGLEGDAARPVNRRREKASDVNIMVLKAGKYQYGLIVDELFDIEEIVVKPLSACLKNCRCFAGATIMGDGRVAMILDAAGIMQYEKLSFSETDVFADVVEEPATDRAGRYKASVILFNVAEEEVFAIPLNNVLRLEKIQSASIERIGSKEFYPYRGKALPLLRLDAYLPIGTAPCDQENVYLIIPKVGNMQASVGILVSRIVDTLEVDVELQDNLAEYGGVMGSALVGGRMTVFIDAAGLFSQAGYEVSAPQESSLARV